MTLDLSGAIEAAGEAVLWHEDQIVPGMIVCSCGWAIAGAPIGAVAAAKAWNRHRAEAVVRAALPHIEKAESAEEAELKKMVAEQPDVILSERDWFIYERGRKAGLEEAAAKGKV